MRRAFVVDFDGTITREDVCDAMAVAFCRPGYRAIGERWVRGEITTQQCGMEIIGLMDVTEDQLLKLVYSVEVDPSFQELVDYCIEQKDIIWIASDGYDFYIEPILRANGWGELPFLSNKLFFRNGEIQLEFMENQGSCKKRLIEDLQTQGVEVFLIGDGDSDKEAAMVSNRVFAKKILLKYCRDYGVDCISYDDFHDVVNRMKEMDQKRNAG